MTRQRAVTTLTTGVAGAGKTYTRASRFLVDEFLIDETGLIVTNFPLNVENITAEISKRTGREAEEVSKRIVIIPRDVELTWHKDINQGGSGPWEWLYDNYSTEQLSGAHIAIDEAHHVCGVEHSGQHKKAWKAFCGELRHRGMTIEFLTQDIAKIAKEIEREAGLWIQVTDEGSRRDPWFRIPLYEWYQLLAKMTGTERSGIWETELQKDGRRWRVSLEKRYSRDPKYYKFYDSFAAPKEGGEGVKPKRLWEQKSAFSLWLWFVSRNFVQLASRFTVVGMLVFFAMGGGRLVIDKYFHLAMGIAKNSTGLQDKSGDVPVVNEKKKDVAVEPYNQSEQQLEPGPEETGYVPVERLKRLVKKIEKERAQSEQTIFEIQNKLQRLQYLESGLDSISELMLIAEDMIINRDGVIYREGQGIVAGKYKGNVIDAIDFEAGRIRLNDGRILVFTNRVPTPFAGDRGSGQEAGLDTVVSNGQGTSGQGVQASK